MEVRWRRDWIFVRLKTRDRSQATRDRANRIGGGDTAGLLWTDCAAIGLAAKNGLDVLAGVIDSDYRGEVCCLLYNTGDEPINLPPEVRFAS